jgi:hypothetical protein
VEARIGTVDSSLMKARAFALVMLLFGVGAVQAVQSACTYRVTQVTSGPTGTITATLQQSSGSGGLNHVSFCPVDTTIQGTSATACRGVLAILLSAQLQQREVTLYFDAPTQFNCVGDSWGNMKTLGWYWGPVLQ